VRKPYRSAWWLILPICSTLVTGLRLAAMREESDRLERTRAAASSPTIPPGAPTLASVQPLDPRSHFSPQPAWVKQIGQLRLVKWGDARTPPERGPETVIIRDGRGRTVARIRGPRVNVYWVGDLTGDGIPDVVLEVCGGVTHAGYVYYVYSAGPRPRCLLAYDKENNMEDSGLWPEFEVKDIDGDGRPEIVTTYDGFAYWDEVERWQTCYAGSARVPLVLGFRRGRLVDITHEYRPWLRQRLAEAKQGFLGDLHTAAGTGLSDEHAQRMIEYYSIGLLLYDRTAARRMVARLLPAEDRAFFLKHCRYIEKVVARRSERYAYPPAYSSVQGLFDTTS
jgi:hypothetical protein